MPGWRASPTAGRSCQRLQKGCGTPTPWWWARACHQASRLLACRFFTRRAPKLCCTRRQLQVQAIKPLFSNPPPHTEANKAHVLRYNVTEPLVVVQAHPCFRIHVWCKPAQPQGMRRQLNMNCTTNWCALLVQVTIHPPPQQQQPPCSKPAQRQQTSALSQKEEDMRACYSTSTPCCSPLSRTIRLLPHRPPSRLLKASRGWASNNSTDGAAAAPKPSSWLCPFPGWLPPRGAQLKPPTAPACNASGK